MKEIKLAKKLEAKYRKIRRFVVSPTFQVAWKKCKDKENVLSLIEDGKIDILREWAYFHNPLIDAPSRWLKDQANKHEISNYSRKTKMELVNELSGILKQLIEQNEASIKRVRSTEPSTKCDTKRVQNQDSSYCL